MVYVSDDYVERLAGSQRLEETVAEFESRRAKVRESVYPCPTCRRAMFLLWDGGHLHSDHDRGHCADCVAVFGDPTPRRRT